METGKSNGSLLSSTPTGVVMQGNLDSSLVCHHSPVCGTFFFFLLSFSVVLGARPSKRRKSSNSNNINNNQRRKKAKAKSTVPSGTQVIDLVDDVPARSTTSHSMALPSATVPNPPSISIGSLCLTQQGPSTPAIVPIVIAQASPATNQSEALSTSTHMPVHSNAPTLQPINPNLLSSLSLLSSLPMPPMPSNETPPSQVVGKNSTLMTVISSPPATDTTICEQGQQVQPHQVKYLSQTAHQFFC